MATFGDSDHCRQEVAVFSLQQSWELLKFIQMMSNYQSEYSSEAHISRQLLQGLIVTVTIATKARNVSSNDQVERD